MTTEVTQLVCSICGAVDALDPCMACFHGSTWRDRAERAERFARAWKALAKWLFRHVPPAADDAAAWDRHVDRWEQRWETEHRCGAAEQQARIVELVRGLMCPPGNEDCDMCIAYRAVITTIEANP